jgi:VCBS repeat-containing protein
MLGPLMLPLGTLTISSSGASATLAQAEAALEAITYQNTDTGNPVANTRTLTWTATDAVGGGISAPVTSDIVVTAVDDAPTVTIADATWNENTHQGSGFILDNLAILSDPDSDTVTSITVAIGTGFQAEDSLSSAAIAGFNAGVFTGDTLTITSSGASATIAQAQAALTAIQYNNSAGDIPTSGNRNLTWTINDGINSISGVDTNTLTVNAENDAPAITVEVGDSDSETLTETNAGLSMNDTITVTDVDLTDLVSSSVTGVMESGKVSGITNATLLAMMSITGDLDTTETTEALAWTFNSGAETFDYLAVGETLTLTYTIEVDDGTTTDIHDITINIDGSNDTPILTITDTGADVTEDAAATLIDSGTLSITDIDTTDTHTINTNYNNDINWTGGTLTPAQITTITNGFSADNNSWDYSLLNSEVNFLTGTDTITFTVDVTVDDGSGGTDTETVTVTINGTNDAPVLDAIGNQTIDETTTLAFTATATDKAFVENRKNL